MHRPDGFWSYFVHLTKYLRLSPFLPVETQHPLGLPTNGVNVHDVQELPYPYFQPQGHGPGWEGSDFHCNYSTMIGWEYCYTPEDPGCWLRKKGTNETYNILTDYEKKWPPGIDRSYHLTVSNGSWNTDGLMSHNLKLVNDQYPGPWVQACWGDRIVVNVQNKLPHNGTAIHWHGIRQFGSTWMDGVPGVTQCPIAPGDSFEYSFTATQYGSSWYHSHYSVQYADGLLGPLTIHGPSSASYDRAKLPLLISDWFHNSAFGVIHGTVAAQGTILLNGTGDVTKFPSFGDSYKNDSLIPKKTQLQFDRKNQAGAGAPKYLLRLINTAFSSTFIFSIDHHLLTIVSADFVPVKAQKPQSHIMIGIGQRYNVIVEAKPVGYNGSEPPQVNDFWIRTTNAECFDEGSITGVDDYDKTGILRYDRNSEANPTTTKWPNIDQECRDERNLVPMHSWTVKPPVNGNPNYGERFEVQGFGGAKPGFPLAQWSIKRWGNNNPYMPFQITYEQNMFLRLNESEGTKWPDSWVVVPEKHTEQDWIWLLITGSGDEGVMMSHPIHMHGHDFAVLQVSKEPFNEKILNPKLDNPSRRDVIHLPNRGFVLLAFKADNPGAWVLHCHIAFHVSRGMALQILENQVGANRLPGKDLAAREAARVCKNWNNWYDNHCEEHWPGWDEKRKCFPACEGRPGRANCLPPSEGKHLFQDDSGI